MKHGFYFSLQIFLRTLSARMKFGRVSRRKAHRSATSFDYFCPIFTWSVWTNSCATPQFEISWKCFSSYRYLHAIK